MIHPETEHVVEERDEERDSNRDEYHDERVRNRLMRSRPDNVSELFADMLQIGEW